jgi:hypothetical protein
MERAAGPTNARASPAPALHAGPPGRTPPGAALPPASGAPPRTTWCSAAACPIPVHDLGHTFGTMAAQCFPLADVWAYMGDADIGTKMIYARHAPQHAAAERLTQLVQVAPHRPTPRPCSGPRYTTATSGSRRLLAVLARRSLHERISGLSAVSVAWPGRLRRSGAFAAASGLRAAQESNLPSRGLHGRTGF